MVKWTFALRANMRTTIAGLLSPLMKTRFSSSLLTQLFNISALPFEVRTNIVERVGGLPLHLYPFEDIDEAVDACLDADDATNGKYPHLASAIAQFLYVVGASAQEPHTLLRAVGNSIKDRSIDADVVVGFLSKLLESHALLIGAKATALYEESEQLLMDSKLLLDVRPIFDPRRPDLITASALIYKLRMTFRSQHSGDAEAMIFTLRESDLQELAVVVDRALKKAAVIREARPFGVTLVESKNDNDDIR